VTTRKKQSKKFRRKSEESEILLRKLAKVLDECSKHKVKIKLRHGIVMSDYGYVLPFKRRWVVRMLVDLGYTVDDGDD
jgi:hypothetical protein